jgi:hypothetical protein
MRLSVCALAMSLALPAPAGAFESVYQDLNLDKDCKLLGSEETSESASWQCKGYKEYPVWFSEGDLRQSIFYGHVGDWYQKGAFESFGPFNHFSGRIEWLVKNGAAMAAITRFFVENSEEPNDAKRGQILVISKVGQPGTGEACVIGYVDARADPEPNVLARRVAEENVTSFVCRKDEPVYHGVRGEFAADPNRYFEGQQ